MRAKAINLVNSSRRCLLNAARINKWPAFLLIGAFVVGLAGSACTPSGSYPLDIFYEMHYQVSYRAQEPPRLYPAEQSVPITGKEVQLTSMEMAEKLINPIPNQGIESGKNLFEINCSMCHGMDAKGAGPTIKIMTNNDPAIGVPYNYQPQLPTNLILGLMGRSENWIFAMISDRDLILLESERPKVMPRFEGLLTPEERWMIVNYINTLQSP